MHAICNLNFLFTHFIEFVFESVVVDIIGDVLQFATLVEIDNGVVSESMDDFAVV